MAESAYAYWQAMLAHKADPKKPLPDFDKAHPETGFYRGTRDNAAVAIWWQDGACLAQVHKPARTGGALTVSNWSRADVISDNLFSTCCRNPITHAAYKAFVASGVWPEDVNLPKPEPAKREGMKEYRAEDRADAEQARSINEMNPPPRESESEGESGTAETIQRDVIETTSDQAFSTEIDTLITSAEDYLTSIERKITEKTHADRLANYALAAGGIATRAENARKTEKQPHWDAARAVDVKWNPVIERAEKTTRNLKTLLVPYFAAEKRKATEAAAEAQKQREAATLAGEVPTLARATPSATVAGTSGRVSLRSQRVYRITDMRAAAEFLAKMNAPPQEFVEGLLSSAQKLMKAGVEVPGVEASSENTVA